jgi:hypothetical protein
MSMGSRNSWRRGIKESAIGNYKGKFYSGKGK